MRKILYTLLFLISFQCSPQIFANNTVDSLLSLVDVASEDSSKAHLYYQLGRAYNDVDNQSRLIAHLKAEKLYRRLPCELHSVYNLIRVAYCYFQEGNFNKAEKYYINAINIAREADNLEAEFKATEHYLDRFRNINSPVKSLERIFELKERTIKSGDKRLLFTIYNLINDQYLVLGTKIEERRKTADTMLIIAEEIQDPLMLRTAYFNLAVSSSKIKAIDFYKTSLNYADRENDKNFLTSVYNNISGQYRFFGDLELAVAYADSAYEISEEIGRKEGMAAARMRKAEAMYFKNKFGKAVEYAKEALQIFKEAKILRRQNSCAAIIAAAYKGLGNYKQALRYNEMGAVLTDSIERMTHAKEAEFIDRKFSYDLAIKRDSISLNQERTFNKLKIESMNAQLSKERMQRYVLYGGISVVVLFLIMIWVGFQRKRKDNIIISQQKLDVERQKEEIEQQHLEMTESITYAKRIQSAILPPDKIVKEYLKESFVLYKPKDIVAGDFYWMESVAPTGKNKESVVLFAAADCTGHGVPGAMVSVVCNNALNRSVREHGLTDPGEMLDKSREIVIEEFEKSEEEVKDGMDIALCSLEGNQLEYAGAHNPLWIIREGDIIETKVDSSRQTITKYNNFNLLEIKADKQPIGKFDHPVPYTTHSIELQKGDAIYIFSDGYVDQFGGEKGKKFKVNSFRELLLSIQDKGMEEQKIIIDETFESWRGGLEQIDDVCVIGVRIAYE